MGRSRAGNVRENSRAKPRRNSEEAMTFMLGALSLLSGIAALAFQSEPATRQHGIYAVIAMIMAISFAFVAGRYS